MNNTKIIQILLFALVFFCLIFIFLIYQYFKRINEKNKDAIFLENKKVKTKYLYASYNFFNRWIITRFYIEKIKKRYEIIYPKNIRKIGELTMLTALKVWFVSIVLIVFACISGITIYMTIITTALIYIVNSYFIFKSVDIQEIQLMKQLDKFLATIRHHYYQTGNVTDAIEESLADTEEPMLAHADLILQILNDDNMEDSRDRYNDIVPNRFLRTFLALCTLIIKFGDRTVDGQSLLLKNLTNLKDEIAIEIRKREKINHKFSGLAFVAVFPMYTLEFIQKWAVQNLPELKLYYDSAFGIVLSVIICVGSLIIYNLLNIMKESNKAEDQDYFILEKISDIKWVNVFLTTYVNRRYGKTVKLNNLIHRVGDSITVKQLLLKRILYSIMTIIIGLSIAIMIHYTSKRTIIYYTENLVRLSASASKNETEEIKTMIVKYTNIYKKEKLDNNLALKVKNDLESEGIFWNKQIVSIMTDEIVSRVNNYQKEYFKWWELIIIFLSSGIAFQVPYWMLLYRKKVMQMNMEDEIIQYQTIILMLMHIERVSTNDILVWIENFAVIFKASIEECLNDFSFGELEALEELREKEPFEPFQRLVDNLLMCDRIGIKKAFDEVAIERKNYQEKRIQENEIYIENKSVIASKLAFVPLIGTIGLYLIVPFIAESMSQLIGYLQQFSF